MGGPARPSILLVTLDTTRADAIGPEAVGIETPAFNALAARGLRFRQAYATVPETLPSHASMMTGLYPPVTACTRTPATWRASHAARSPSGSQQAGYRTAAFVSSFVLARRFGLARGFDVYDDELRGGRAERTAARDDRCGARVPRARRAAGGRCFLWVHYYDPHAPYAPPEPFRSR